MRNLLVFLDLSKMDKVLLRYVANFRQTLDVERITLLHFVKIQDIGDLRSYFDLEEDSVEEIIENEIREKAGIAGLDENNFEVEVFLKGGFDRVLEWVNQSSYDLCILGKKIIHGGSGSFPGKMVRLSEKSMLLVSESSRPDIRKLLVPIDFSNHSKKAVKMAASLAKNPEKQELLIMNVFRVPQTYFPYLGEWDRKHVERQMSDRKTKVEKFIAGIRFKKDPRIAIEYGNGAVGEIIYAYAVEQYFDLIVLSIKGKNNAGSLLIGNVSYHLIQPQKEVAVLLVK